MKLTLANLKLTSAMVMAIGVVVTVILSGLIVFFLILPILDGNDKINQAVLTANGDLQKVTTDLAALKTQDLEKLAEIKLLVDSLLPGQLDILNFITLNDVVAQASNVSVTGVQVVKAVVKPPVAPAASSKTPTPVPTPTTQTSQVAPTSYKVSYESSFDSLLALIANWKLANRLVGIVDITVTASSGADRASYTISYNLPTYTAGEETKTTSFMLTAAEKALITKLQKDIIYTATPSAQPVGKANPFQ